MKNKKRCLDLANKFSGMLDGLPLEDGLSVLGTAAGHALVDSVPDRADMYDILEQYIAYLRTVVYELYDQKKKEEFKIYGK